MKIPTSEQILKIKCTSSKMYMYVSKNLIMRIIMEWEKIRGGKDPKEIFHDGHIKGFNDALDLLSVPDCQYCGSRMEHYYVCGDSFIAPQGQGCDVCKNVPMHSSLIQVLQDWVRIRSGK